MPRGLIRELVSSARSRDRRTVTESRAACIDWPSCSSSRRLSKFPRIIDCSTRVSHISHWLSASSKSFSQSVKDRLRGLLFRRVDRKKSRSLIRLSWQWFPVGPYAKHTGVLLAKELLTCRAPSRGIALGSVTLKLTQTLRSVFCRFQKSQLICSSDRAPVLLRAYIGFIQGLLGRRVHRAYSHQFLKNF